MQYSNELLFKIRTEFSLEFEWNSIQYSNMFKIRTESHQGSIENMIQTELFNGVERIPGKRNSLKNSNGILFRIRMESCSGFEWNLVYLGLETICFQQSSVGNPV